MLRHNYSEDKKRAIKRLILKRRSRATGPPGEA